jgi:hypothetical protein
MRDTVSAWVAHPVFDGAIMVLISLNCVCLAMYNPLKPEDSGLNQVLNDIDMFFTIAFTIELIFKWLGPGPVKYFKDGFNWLDILCVAIGCVPLPTVFCCTGFGGRFGASRGAIFSSTCEGACCYSLLGGLLRSWAGSPCYIKMPLITKAGEKTFPPGVHSLRRPPSLWLSECVLLLCRWVGLMPGAGDTGGLSAIRSLRVLRPLRTMSSFPGLRVIAQTILASLPMCGVVLLLAMYLFSIFAIFGVQSFAGVLKNRSAPACNDRRRVVEPSKVLIAMTGSQCGAGVSRVRLWRSMSCRATYAT